MVTVNGLMNALQSPGEQIRPDLWVQKKEMFTRSYGHAGPPRTGIQRNSAHCVCVHITFSSAALDFMHNYH